MQLAVQTCVPACTPEEMERVDPVLRVPGDKREGQLIVNFDRVFMAVENAIEEYGLERPDLFKADGIDRRSMTYFNTNNEVGLVKIKACIRVQHIRTNSDICEQY